MSLCRHYVSLPIGITMGCDLNVLSPFLLFSSQVLANLGAADIDSRLEEQLIDGILFAFQEQTNEVHKGLMRAVCKGLIGIGIYNAPSEKNSDI